MLSPICVDQQLPRTVPMIGPFILYNIISIWLYKKKNKHSLLSALNWPTSAWNSFFFNNNEINNKWTLKFSLFIFFKTFDKTRLDCISIFGFSCFAEYQKGKHNWSQNELFTFVHALHQGYSKLLHESLRWLSWYILSSHAWPLIICFDNLKTCDNNQHHFFNSTLACWFAYF